MHSSRMCLLVTLRQSTIESIDGGRLKMQMSRLVCVKMVMVHSPSRNVPMVRIPLDIQTSSTEI